jgi:hypothetical protein
MKLFDKIKNILFEEEEVEPAPISKEDSTPQERTDVVKEEPVNRFKNINYEEVKVVEEETPKKVDNSPFQQFDEEEFERIAAVNKSRLIERDRKLREEKAKVNDKHDDYDYHQIKKEPEVKKPPYEVKHFTPSPVISPVYGILDKNYKKDDILPKASSDGTLPKVMDVDRVRQKAFGTLESDIEKVITTNQNTTDDVLTSADTLGEEELIKTSEIKITNFEDEVESDTTKPIIDDEAVDEVIPDDETNNIKEDDQIDEIIDEASNSTKTAELKKDDANLESDLFNLIDSMYQDKEDKN